YDGKLRLWETVTGKEVLRFGGKPRTSHVLFSPDGGLLAAWSPGAGLYAPEPKGWFAEESVGLWDTATGREMVRLEGHQGPVTTVAFTPNGKILATGSGDTTVLVWDLTGVRKKPAPAKQLYTAELNVLWADLASEDAARAYRAVVTLCASPGQSVPLLQQHLRPVAVDLRRIPGLVADLDHERFATRETAMRELESLHEMAIPALRKALDKGTTPEAWRRIEQLLEKCERYRIPSGEPLRALRAVMLLDRLGTLEARQILQVLAKGPSEAPLTRDAQAALQRLDRRLTFLP